MRTNGKGILSRFQQMEYRKSNPLPATTATRSSSGRMVAKTPMDTENKPKHGHPNPWFTPMSNPGPQNPPRINTARPEVNPDLPRPEVPAGSPGGKGPCTVECVKQCAVRPALVKHIGSASCGTSSWHYRIQKTIQIIRLHREPFAGAAKAIYLNLGGQTNIARTFRSNIAAPYTVWLVENETIFRFVQ